MTIPVLILISWLAGASMAVCGKEGTDFGEDPIASPYFAVVFSFAVGAIAPMGLSFYLLSPDWSLMYLANPAHLPLSAMLPGLAVIYLASPSIGYLTIRWMLRRNIHHETWFLILSVSFILLTIIVTGRVRLFSLAYYDDYHYGGERIPFFSSSLFFPVVIISAVVTTVYLLSILKVRHHVSLSSRLSDKTKKAR